MPFGKCSGKNKSPSPSPISFGVKAGFNASTLTRSDGYDYDNNDKMKAGFNAGVFVNIPVEQIQRSAGAYF
jgi:hypothetical protein